jgi:uncharacterized protein (TIGR02284 family)
MMATETKSNLSQETIDKLQQLIRMNIDSENGFDESAKQIEDRRVADLFTELSGQRAQYATELQDYVQWNGEAPRDEGSYAAAFHRFWIDLKAKVSGGDAHTILSEAERGEDQIKEAYEDALTSTAGSAMNDVLSRQYAAIKRGHDQVRDLRDAYAKKPR